MKKTKFEAWKSDNSVWSIQEDLLRVSIPLIKAVEKIKSMPDELRDVKTLLTSSGSLLGSAIQRVSIFRQRHADPFIKEGYLRDVTPSMNCILGDEWAQKVEEEEKLNKVTQKVVKDTLSTSTKPKSFFKDRFFE